MGSYVGIDLHRRRSVVVVLNDDGDRVSWCRIDNTPANLAREVVAAGERAEVAMEATWGWYWAADVIAECGARLHLAHPEVAKIILLDTYDRDIVVNAFRSGARGLFCFSQYPFRLLCKCIQSVHQGQVWANSEQMQYLVESLSQVPSLHMVNSRGMRLLTPREEQVVALVADGLSNREVAREICPSEHTIKKYLL